MRFSLLLCLLASTAFGQIDVPPETPDRHPIIASVNMAIPEEADVQGPGWILPDGVRGIPCGQTAVYLWADPGEHQIGYKVFWIHITEFTFTDGAGKEITIKQYMGHGYVEESAIFTVIGEQPKPNPKPDDPPPNTTPDQAVYIYEKDDGAIPAGVLGALAELNEGGKIQAVPFEMNQRDGDGDVPERYAVAYAASLKFQRPCLVLVSGDKTRVVSVESYEDVKKAVNDG